MKCQGIISGFLVAINVLLLILSVLLVIFAGFCLWNKQTFQVIINTLVAPRLPSDLNIDSDQFREIGNQLLNLMDPMATTILVIGLLIFVSTVLAFVGVGLCKREIIIAYAVLISCLIAIHVIMILIYFINKQIYIRNCYALMEDTFKSYTYYDNSTTARFTAMMTQLWQCCGFDSPNDFTKPGYKLNETNALNQRTRYPSACCKPGSTGSEATQCPQEFSTTTAYIERGCRYVIDENLIQYMDYAANYSLIVMIFTIAALVLAILIIVFTKVG